MGECRLRARMAGMDSFAPSTIGVVGMSGDLDTEIGNLGHQLLCQVKRLNNFEALILQ